MKHGPWLPVKKIIMFVQVFMKLGQYYQFYENMILTKFNDVWRKIVGFLVAANFKPCLTSIQSPFTMQISTVATKKLSVWTTYIKEW